MDSAPWVTFLWVNTFPLSFSPASLVPLLICYVVCSIEVSPPLPQIFIFAFESLIVWE